MKTGIRLVGEHGYEAVIVVRHPKYYPRFGFQPASIWNIQHPFDVPYDAFLALELKENALKNFNGTVDYPKEFYDAI